MALALLTLSPAQPFLSPPPHASPPIVAAAAAAPVAPTAPLLSSSLPHLTRLGVVPGMGEVAVGNTPAVVQAPGEDGASRRIIGEAVGVEMKLWYGWVGRGLQFPPLLTLPLYTNTHSNTEMQCAYLHFATVRDGLTDR